MQLEEPKTISRETVKEEKKRNARNPSVSRSYLSNRLSPGLRIYSPIVFSFPTAFSFSFLFFTVAVGTGIILKEFFSFTNFWI